MLNWLRKIFIGCNHTYEPYGNIVKAYTELPSEKNKYGEWHRTQSQRCTKCGNIKIMKV